MWALCCDTKGYVTMGVWRQLTSSILTVRAFPANTALTKCWFNVGQRRRCWSNIKTAFGECRVGWESSYCQYAGGQLSPNPHSNIKCTQPMQQATWLWYNVTYSLQR